MGRTAAACAHRTVADPRDQHLEPGVFEQRRPGIEENDSTETGEGTGDETPTPVLETAPGWETVRAACWLAGGLGFAC